METTKHTPGPWADGDTRHIMAAVGNNSVLIAEVHHAIHDTPLLTKEQGRANAALISAAPEMLEALESALALIESGTLRISHDVDTSAVSKVKSAIAKAKG